MTGPGRSQSLVYGCLILSGSTSLVYELLWTRILSFSFGSTSLAFAAVLAVFFLGLAGGSLLGGKAARRLANPLRAYGWLELAIGAYAGAAFPLLFKLHHLFSLHNAGGAEPSGLAFRFLIAALVLALPTLCMGATFPILLEHLRRERSHLTEAMGRLYGINTLGAFLGVYMATHWLIPVFGLDKANYIAVGLNLAVFALVWAGSPRPVPASGLDDREARGADAPGPAPRPEASRYAWIGLILLAASGCTTLGYEVVWGRVLTISLEGSLYGIGTTLGSFLAGIGLGGVAFSFFARRLDTAERLFRAYLAVCLVVIAYLALSRLLLPVEGYLLKAVNHTMRGILGLHAGFGLGVLFLLPITAGLGFMFPAAVALYNQGSANPAEGAGKAYALNTAMSVLGSIASASVLMDRLGIEGIVFLGSLIMLGSLLAAVLLAEAGKPGRRLWLAAVMVPLVLAAGWWPSIDAKTVLLGAYDGKPPSPAGLFRSLAAQFSPQNGIKVYKDGVGTTLTVILSGRSVSLQSNGLPQSGREMDPPHYNLESSLVGLLPALHKPDASNALVIGLGAGVSVGVLRMAGIPRVEVVELEPSMADICRGIYPAGLSPLDDTGVTLHLDDARNFLVRNRYRPSPAKWDIIASQPAHPWVSGAADLFTEEMFRLAYGNLAEDGVFCQWFIGSGIDTSSFSALANAFGRVFDQILIYRSAGVVNGLYFIGTRGRPALSLPDIDRLFARPGLRQLLELHNHRRPSDVFKYAVTGLSDGASILTPGAPVNRDRNAFVEARVPLLPKSAALPLDGVGGASFTGPLPQRFRDASARETLFVFEAMDALSGNIPRPIPNAEEDSLRFSRFQAFRKHAPTPFREYYGIHLALAAGAGAESLDSAAIRADRAGHSLLAHQINLLRLRKWPAATDVPALAGFDSLPKDFRVRFDSRRIMAQAEAKRFPAAESLAARGSADSLSIRMVRLLKAFQHKDPALSPLDEAALDSLYMDCHLAWANRPHYLEALEWYCAAMGKADMAAMTRRISEKQQEMALARLMERGMRLKDAGRHAEALGIFDLALRMNPASQNAYMAKAEIFRKEKNRPAYESLISDIRRVFPRPDVTLQRVKEAFELKPRIKDVSEID